MDLSHCINKKCQTIDKRSKTVRVTSISFVKLEKKNIRLLNKRKKTQQTRKIYSRNSRLSRDNPKKAK